MKPFSRKAKVLLSILGIAAACSAIFCFYVLLLPPVEHPSLGVTFSTSYARWLGLDPREAFDALLRDMHVRRFRIPVYWSEVEPSDGDFRWEDVDWMMSEAGKYGASVTLAVGYKVPRWPECYIPDWAKTDDGSFDKEGLSDFLRAVVTRYEDSSALARWQVNNEPYLAYGVCPEVGSDEISREADLVRSLDADHPIVMTVSGELERWAPTVRQSDALGFSLYRDIWSPYFGFVRYPLPAAFYRVRSWLVGFATDSIFISELQAEPWFSESVKGNVPSELAARFTSKQLRENVSYAKRTGITDMDLWGAEWWYFLYKNGEPGLWNEAVRLFSTP
jgi:hypothetical protein